MGRPRREGPPDPERTFNGNPCVHGHDGLRYKTSGACVWCTIAKGRARPTKAENSAHQAGAAMAADPRPTDQIIRDATRQMGRIQDARRKIDAANGANAPAFIMCVTPGCRTRSRDGSLWCLAHDPARCARETVSKCAMAGCPNIVRAGTKLCERHRADSTTAGGTASTR